MLHAFFSKGFCWNGKKKGFGGLNGMESMGTLRSKPDGKRQGLFCWMAGLISGLCWLRDEEDAAWI